MVGKKKKKSEEVEVSKHPQKRFLSFLKGIFLSVADSSPMPGRLVCLACLVCLICLLCLVYLYSLPSLKRTAYSAVCYWESE